MGEESGSSDDDLLRDVLGMRAQPPPVVLAVDQVIDDTFKVEGELGAGGMGRVYRARDLSLGRTVALKLLASTTNERREERLAREAAALARLTHPNVVTVYAVGSWNGHPWVAMEHVGGGTARAWLDAEPRSTRAILDLYVAAARGLAAAHAAGLVHRDFKPENVLVGTDGRVRVADFGLARDVDTPPDAPADVMKLAPLTRTGAVLGTPGYMAPEQRSGRRVGPAADQFAFAVSVWEALAGQRPFAGETTGELDHAIARNALREAPPTMPRHVAIALRRALAADPQARWPSLDALADELARDPVAHRKRILLAVAGAVSIAVAAAVAVVLARGARDAVDCDAPSPALTALWSPAKRTALAEQLTAAGGDGTRTVAAIDAWTQRWSAQRRGACRATHVERVQSVPMLDQRVSCLDRTLVDLEATLELLASPDRRVGSLATQIANGLPPLDTCADGARLSGTRPAADPTQQMQRWAVEAALARVQTLTRAQLGANAVEVATTALAMADAIGDPSLRGRATRLLGSAHYVQGNRQAVLGLYEESARLSAIAHDDLLAAEAWNSVFEFVVFLGKPAEAERVVTIAEAALARAGDPPGLRANFLYSRARYEALRGDFARSRDDLLTAIDLEAKHGSDAATVARDYHALGQAYVNLRDFPKARAALARAATELEAGYGPHHANLGVILTSLGGAEYTAGDYRAARATLERALAHKEATVGPHHPGLAATLGNLALTQLELGELDAAQVNAQRAFDLVEASVGPAHPKLGNGYYTLGLLQQARGELDEAATTFARGIEILDAAGGAPPIGEMLTALAEVELQQHRVGPARLHLERALQLTGENTTETAKALGILGKLQLSVGELSAGLASLERSQQMLAALLGPDHPDVRRTTAELAALRGSRP